MADELITGGDGRVPSVVSWEHVPEEVRIRVPTAVMDRLLAMLGPMLAGDDSTTIRLKVQALGLIQGAAVSLGAADSAGNFSFDLASGWMWPTNQRLLRRLALAGDISGGKGADG